MAVIVDVNYSLMRIRIRCTLDSTSVITISIKKCGTINNDSKANLCNEMISLVVEDRNSHSNSAKDLDIVGWLLLF